MSAAYAPGWFCRSGPVPPASKNVAHGKGLSVGNSGLQKVKHTSSVQG